MGAYCWGVCPGQRRGVDALTEPGDTPVTRQPSLNAASTTRRARSWSAGIENSSSRPASEHHPLVSEPGGFAILRWPPTSYRAGSHAHAGSGFGLSGILFRAVLPILVAVVDMADVADGTWVSTEQELLEQAVRRLPRRCRRSSTPMGRW